ncbi:hypothetical protein D3C85_1738290 [compost metagenome]
MRLFSCPYATSRFNPVKPLSSPITPARSASSINPLALAVFTQNNRPCGVSPTSQVPGSLRLGSLERLNQTCPPSTWQLSMDPVFGQ